MKHYIVLNGKSEIVAQSRSKDSINQYYNSLSKKKKKKYDKRTLEMDEKTRREFEREFSEQEVWESEFLGEQVHEDNEEMYSFAQEEYDKLETLIKDLSNVIDNYNLHREDKRILKRSYDLLKRLSKKKNFSRAIGFDLITELEKDGKLPILKRLFSLGGNNNAKN